MSSRRRPLQTCVVSFLAVAHSTCSRAQNLDGRLGSITRKMVRIAKLMKPLIFVLQYQCLLVLSFIDDRLLAIANILEKIFPPFKLVFDKIDHLLHLIETFPSKFDDAVDEIPCFNQVLLLDWTVTHAISLLKFMITILMNWGRDGTREKEILVDMNYKEGRKSESTDKSECCSEGIVSSVSETQQAEAAMDEKMKSNSVKGTCKEVLKMDEDSKENEKSTNGVEKGTRNEMDDKEDCKNNEKGNSKEVEKGIEVVEDNESCKKDENNENKMIRMEESVEKTEGNEEIPDEGNSRVKEEKEEEEEEEEEEGLMDYESEKGSNGSMEILELFETAWLMKPTIRGQGNMMPRSASFL
ncbi:myelin transcription factor 1 [Benincasa hispida]|uniref:myelin transcription factor 1 n=1 Tax=Benincasa hispida TaxID=102211 RepID=UPI0019007A24|nr:myelin transcription factor 1 [Benincasa hispida]XP_038884035.1 myelin transcription factor 1 [Benincasa hispida]